MGVLLLSVLAALVIADSSQASGPEIPPELKRPNYRVRDLEGIGYDRRYERQDPSNVIKVGATFYAWYTHRKPGVHPYASTIHYATSQDGTDWEDKGQALGKGSKGEWDSYGVITPYVAALDGTYYLFYTGTDDHPFGGEKTLRHIGIAVADDPDGPWKKLHRNPVLSPGKNTWDGLLVDDAHLIVRGGKYWLYYKGRKPHQPPHDSSWGLAIADKPTGPYEKHDENPLLHPAHTVCVWPHRTGVAALVDLTNTVHYAPDGIHFTKVTKTKRGVLTGCGPYDPDAFTNTEYGRGIRWGIAQRRKRQIHITRFECDLRAPPRD